MIIDIICVLIWLYWAVYSVVGHNIQDLKIGLLCASLACVIFYVERLLMSLGILKKIKGVK